MCGIAGIIAPHGSDTFDRALRDMTNALTHRGPDGRGTLVRRHGRWDVGLGHTRLAIIDLSPAGKQPMEGTTKPCWLTYNGEVYNFRDLRTGLEAEGHRFRSRTDSEVVLRAYEARGVEAISHLRGMFAFGLWDEEAGELLLARDPFGVKPLYYYQDGHCFLFASEVGALLASGLVPRRLSQEGITSYLRWGAVEAPATILRDVRCLRPGYYMIVRLEEQGVLTREVSYAQRLLDGDGHSEVQDRSEAVELLRNLLEESVRLHLVSDVPLGAFLSGGIDSSAIVALMSRVAGEPPRTFTVVFDEEEFSEAPHARTLAETYGTDHQEILLTEDRLLGMLPDALGALDQPTMDGVNSYVVSRAVKEAGLTVALSGLGGDELFAGYSSFRAVKWMSRLAGIPRGVRRALSNAGISLVNGTIRERKLFEIFGGDGSPLATYRIARQLFSPREVGILLQETPAPLDEGPRRDEPDPINAVSRYEIQGYMANMLLRDTDSTSMSHALEVRVPFVDPEVAPFVIGLPGEWKLDGRRPKPLLLDALGDLLPEEVWRRPKMGFTLPFARWTGSALAPEMERVLLRESSRFVNLGLQPGGVERIWAGYQGSRRKVGWYHPWTLYVLARWCTLHDVTSS